jgi:hypothetical protein
MDVNQTMMKNPNDPEEITPCQRWSAEVTAAEKELKPFYERARRAVSHFLDERDPMTAQSKWFNIFYANTQILESALYAELPKPTVSRRFTDFNDDVARVGAVILERCISSDFDDPSDTLDLTIRHAVQDRLVAGLAQAWLRLETDTEEISVPPTPGNDTDGPDDLAESKSTAKKITSQRVAVDYIFWQDFLWSPCRVWEERRWVGRRAYMTYEELVERFGQDKADLCPLNFTTTNLQRDSQVPPSTPKEDVVKKAEIYEIWDREEREVIWYSKGMTELLDTKPDPLGLRGFEPCPKPMLANISTSNTVPRPDYYMLQDQYSELDVINNRLSMLIQACKVVGTYDQTQPAVGRMLGEAFDNQLVPVDNWAMFAEKGGLKGVMDWLPLDSVVQAIQQLNMAREVIKGQIYELTGIADIVRGATKASETLGAQQIKAQFASVRIKKLQGEVACFASDIMRIKGEIMARHFDPEILAKKSNIMNTPDAAVAPAAIQLIKEDEAFEWRINVSVDTISQADYALEKADRIEFLTASSKYMEQAVQMLDARPEAAPLILSIFKWAVSSFRGAQEIEGMLDKSLDALIQNPPKPKPNPEAQKAQAEQQQAQQQAMMEQQKMQMEMQTAQQKAAMDQQAQQQELAMKQQEAMLDQQARRQEMMFEQQMQQMQLMFEQAMNATKLQYAQEKADVDLQTAQAKAVASAASRDTRQ